MAWKEVLAEKSYKESERMAKKRNYVSRAWEYYEY
jgi:hypothetical protein